VHAGLPDEDELLELEDEPLDELELLDDEVLDEVDEDVRLVDEVEPTDDETDNEVLDEVDEDLVPDPLVVDVLAAAAPPVPFPLHP
jgi:hypothetical protein